jgi:hypothetical protein
MKSLFNGENPSSNQFQGVCSGFPEAACDSKNVVLKAACDSEICSESRP